MADKNAPPENKKGGGKKPNRRKPQGDDKFEWSRASRTLLFWILIVILSWIIFSRLNLTEKPERTVSFTDYRRYIENDQIASAEIIEREFHGKLKNDEGVIVTTLPFIDQGMLSEWDSLRIDYQFKEKTTSWLGIIITSFLPWIVIIALWLYLMRRMQGGGSRGVFSFGKSRAKLMMEFKTRLTFADVAGCDEAKEELQEVIAFLRDPKKFSRLGGRLPKGALLVGPPGTGKTLLARAVAGEAEVPFFSISGADFVEMFVGVGAARVRDLFEQGKKNAPCIIFIDEIDAVGRHRGAGLGGGHDEREQTLNQLLVEMDGFESNEGVILIAATNRPDVLDPALTRPGRFDRQIVVDRPDVRGREGILKVHTRNIPLASDVRLDVLAKGSPGLAGADLANLVNEAALLAARRNAKEVEMFDFENAKDKVMMGAERKSMLISDNEKRQTAVHEAGHVLVARFTPGADPVHKVTIIPRGRALGLTHYLPIDEKHNYSRSYLTNSLTHLLGGRAAEKICFNELSTGAGNDIERATEIARKMVCEWGMSDRIGPVSLGNRNDEVFLGRDFVQQRSYSERTAQEVDAEIRRVVLHAEQRAEKILRDNLDKLNLLADALLDREILDSEEIDILLKSGKLPPPHVRPGAEPARAEPKPQRKEPAVQKERSDDAPTPPRRPLRPRKRKAPAAGEDSEDNQGKSRRDFARSYGIASSRDPENRRPTPRQLARDQSSDRAAAADGSVPADKGEADTGGAHTSEDPRLRRPRRRPRSRRLSTSNSRGKSPQTKSPDAPSSSAGSSSDEGKSKNGD